MAVEFESKYPRLFQEDAFQDVTYNIQANVSSLGTSVLITSLPKR